MGVAGRLTEGTRGPRHAPKIVITMPAYKAEATLERTVADIPAGVADHLILVDDASPDNTAALARSLGIDVHVHPQNRGYGENQKTCYTLALREDADVVVMLHPDYQYEPKAVPLLLAPILAGDADMTFGSRFAGLGDPRGGGMPLYRYLGNRVTTIVENLVLGSRFTEMHSGMRAYTRDCLLSLPFLRYSGDFVFDSQLLIDAVTTGQRVVEVPIPTRYTEESSSIGTTASLSYVGRSVAYCVRTVASHGRKRHRSPIGRERLASRDSLGTHPLERVLDLVAGYATLGRRMAVVGSSNRGDLRAIADAGWKLVANDEPAEAAVVLSGLTEAGSPRPGDVQAAADRLGPGGLLAVTATAPRSTEHALRGAGFRLVAWRPIAPRRDDRLGLAVARRVAVRGGDG